MTETAELFTVHEVASILKVNPMTVRRYIAAGKLRAVRVGRSIRIPRDALAELTTPVEPNKGQPTMGQPARRRRNLTYEDPLWQLVGLATDAPPTDASQKHAYLAEDGV